MIIGRTTNFFRETPERCKKWYFGKHPQIPRACFHPNYFWIIIKAEGCKEEITAGRQVMNRFNLKRITKKEASARLYQLAKNIRQDQRDSNSK